MSANVVALAKKDVVLAKLDIARRALAEVKSIPEAKELRDQAVAIELYLRQKNEAGECAVIASEVKARIERVLGQLIMEKGERRGGVSKFHDGTLKKGTRKSLPDGISKKQSHFWQKVAAVPEEEFEGQLARARDTFEPVSTQTFVQMAKNIERQKNEQHREELAVLGAAAALPSGLEIVTGDFCTALNDVADNSVSLIFTDPPYDDESVPLYESLAVHAARVLVDGGSLVTYAGHHALPGIFKLMTPHLRFWWILNLQHRGQSARLPGKCVFVGWKPLLWFVKGGRWNQEFVSDVVPSSPPDKVLHDWEQGTVEAEYLIERLTPVGALVVDPMCGSGTTCLAAAKLGRRCLGIEQDEDRANVARKRLSDLGSERCC